CSPSFTWVVEPTVHGPAGAMAQGVGVPLAAAVRMAQVPNGGMFAPGLQSMTVAASWLSIVYFVWLSTTRLAGALPQVHCSVAPITTACGMTTPLAHRAPAPASAPAPTEPSSASCSPIIISLAWTGDALDGGAGARGGLSELTFTDVPVMLTLPAASMSICPP